MSLAECALGSFYQDSSGDGLGVGSLMPKMLCLEQEIDLRGGQNTSATAQIGVDLARCLGDTCKSSE